MTFKEKENNFAYIDGANLHKGIEDLGWKLDYKRFRIWLKDKYNVERAYIFIGLMPAQKDLYTKLQEMGYVLVYKEVVYDGDGKVKGNCDADLVLKMVVDFFEKQCDNAILVSSDGDYAGLVKCLIEKGKFLTILSPAIAKKCSILLKRTGAHIAYINDQKTLLEYKRKSPR